ncbi:MAG: hypothetical protein ABJD97_12865, partial [Betaproteobacteria bacterium]
MTTPTLLDLAPARAPRSASSVRAIAWAPRIAAAVLVSDLRQRTRSVRFWAIAFAMLIAAWWCFPPVDAGYMIVAIGNHHRGFYSSAWVGMVLAMISMLWGLVGFYAVRGTVQRDFDTRVWQLLGTTSMRRSAYLLAKWASHLVVMGALLVATLAVGLVAQWVRAEDRHVDLVELSKPALFIALPTLAFSAMFAIWFDLLPWLRRTAGNVVFFFVWIALLSSGAASTLHDRQSPAQSASTQAQQDWSSDLPGIEMMQWSIDHQVAPQFPGQALPDGFCVGCGGVTHAPVRFAWTHWDVSAAVLWGRMLWLAVALAGVLLAVPLLDWAAARPTTRGAAPGARAPRTLVWLRAALSPLLAAPLGVLVAAEAFVVLRMRPLWWWAAWAPVWGVQAFGPRHAVALAMLAGWALLLDVFARTGLREQECGTGALVGTAPGGARRLLRARATVLVGLAWVAVAPGLLHEAFAHPALVPAAIALGASLALCGLASAALARSSRPYELVFLVAAYATAQGLPWLDASARGSTVALAHMGAVAAALAILFARSRPGRADQ